MPKPLRLLHAEDNPADAALILRELRRGGLEVEALRVQTREDMQAALTDAAWDLIIADYSMPTFSAPEALFLARRLSPDLPFIVVSGTIGETIAVEMMRNGADDYLMKDNLGRLVAAVEHSLQRAQDRWERRRAEEALRRSLQDYETLYRAIPSGILVVSASGEILSANDFAGQILRQPPEALVGTCLDRLMQLAFAEDGSPLPVSQHPLAVALTAGEPVRGCVAGLQLGNEPEIVWLLVNAEPILDAVTGHPTAAVVTFLDRTEHRRTERTLRERERQFREMTELMPDLLVEFDIDGALTYANRVAYTTFGYTHEDPVLGRPVHEFLGDEDRPRVLSEIAALARRGGEAILNHTLKHRDGQPIPVESHVMPRHDENGHCLGFRVVLRNLTGRLRTQQALRESEARFRVMFEESPVPYQSLDEEGRILDVNPRWLEMLGYGRQEVMGRSFADFLIPSVRASFPGKFAAFRKAEAVSGIEWPMLCKDGGTVLIASFEGRVARHPDGRFKQTHCVFQDVTEAKRLRDEALKVQKLESLGVLAGGIAHDFNNALLVVMGNLQMARLFPTTDEMHSQQLQNAENACKQAQDLTGQLLTFARGGAPIKKTTDITGLVRDTALFAVSGSNVKCTFDVSGPVPPVEADLGQISQVINNLVINGDQAMPSGGALRITVEAVELAPGSEVPLPPGAYVRIAVADEGTGIAPQNLERIFDPYFTTKPTGNGLGLASCFSIIRGHGGHIGVRSTEGVGTTFTIHLPVSIAPVAADEEIDETLVGGEGRILVMDDEEAVRDFARMILEELGYEVETAREGQEAIAAYEEALTADCPFAAVVLDLTVRGGAGGKVTIEKLQSLDPNVRAVVCSGYSADPVMANYRDYGFRAVVVKPYSVAELARALRRVIEEE